MTSVRPRREALLSSPDAASCAVIAPPQRRWTRTDRGAVTASIIILPVVMLAILLGVHFSLILHGRNVATAAAQDGLHAAQLEFATSGNGQQAAQNTLNLFGGITNASIEVSRDLDTVSVTVRGEVRTPLDGLFNTFEVTRTGPVERFYFESERS